ncbi:FimV/HubP family polar landmark protein [Noviherbaspirillum sedimenti]|nr:FimV/HubP family polar landmark protein [Noviherbaspirillum sedimenti]
MRDHRMPALRTIALVVIVVWGGAGYAAGLGPVRVQSALGQPLRASVPVLGADTPELTASCIRVTLAQPDGTLMMAARADVARNGQATSIQISTRQPVNEPAVTLDLAINCGAAIQRSYQLLLDPVVILPQLAQAQQEGRSGAAAARNAHGEQAMLAPADNTVRVPASPRRAAARKAQGDNAAPAAPATAGMMRSGSSHKAAPPARQLPRKVTRSVLKLSSDDAAVDIGATFAPGLKLADTLSESRDTGDMQKAAELKSAYARFAQVMRGEDPLQNGEKQIQDMQAKLRELESQTAQLRAHGEQQRQADQEALASLRRDTVSSGWAVALGGLLLAALAAIAWLRRRLKEAGRGQPAAFWDKTGLGSSTEAGDWGNTLGGNDTFVAARTESVAPTASKPSDWERGIPLDDTLAVDWASRQATMQSLAPQMSTAAEAQARQMQQAQQDGTSVASGTVEEAAEREIPRIAQPARRTMPATAPAPQPAQAAQAAQQAAPASATAARRNDDAQPMKVEDISDLMQEAEFWMLLNDPARAIEILEPYAGVGQPISPVPWIYLLDLYRLTGQRENYQALAGRIKRRFNANAPAWDDEGAAASSRSLRDYPHVVQAIEDMWESEGIVPYLENLLFDEREGARAGFDLAVYREIIHLIGVARDPETPRRREQLSFDETQPRLISQTVRMPAAKPARPEPLITDEEADVFDRATSLQATSRQVSIKPALPKAPSVGAAPSVEVAPVAAQPMVVAGGGIKESSKDNVKAAAKEVVKADANADDDAERTADMARKLDLVLAYQEIGEHVGARVLLEEVIQGGSPLQVEKAKAMLKRLLKEIDWQ